MRISDWSSDVCSSDLVADGDTVLVHGGTSGIGTMAIKLAALFGLTIIVTAGSDAKCAAARALGADHAINYKTQDFVAEVKAITGGAGVAAVLDMVGGDRSEEHTSELQSLMRNSYAVFCLKKKKNTTTQKTYNNSTTYDTQQV